MLHRLLARAALSSALVFAGLAGAEAARQTAKSTKAEKPVKSAKKADAGHSLGDRECLARAMYFESRRTAEDGMLAVGTIVANRLEAGRYGDTICEVVGRYAQFAPGVLSRKMVEREPAELARRVADAVLSGRRHPVAGNVLYFHTHNVPFRNDDKHYVLVSGGNAFYRWNRGGPDEAVKANLRSLAEAAEEAPENREIGEKIVEAAMRALPNAGTGPEVELKRMPQPDVVRAATAPQDIMTAEAVAPELAPAAPQPIVVAAAETAVADIARPKVAAEIVARPDPLAKALAYRGAPAPAPAGGALAAVANLRFAHAPAPRPSEPGQRQIAPSAPVLASATPVFAEKPRQPKPNPMANIVVAQAWSSFE